MDVALFEKAAFSLCNSQSAPEKISAEESISQLMAAFAGALSPSRSTTASQCLFYTSYLNQVSSPYAQFILFSRLKTLAVTKFSLMEPQELVELRMFHLYLQCANHAHSTGN
jgi:hypothetical protein